MESKSKTLLQDRTLDKYPVAIRQHLCIAWVGENDQRDCRKITDQFRGIYRKYSTLIKENRRMSTCNRLDLQNIRISTDRLCPRIFPITGGLLMVCYCVPVSRRVLLTGRCSFWWGHSSLLFLSCCGFNGLLIFFLHAFPGEHGKLACPSICSLQQFGAWPRLPPANPVCFPHPG